VTAGSSPAAPAKVDSNLNKYMNLVQKPLNFIKEVRAELGKVAWSSRQELTDSTIIVIVITAIMAVFIGAIDIFLSKGLSLLFK
jgi:preprotein translocase subunit SecE